MALKVAGKGQVVIPEALRQKYGLKPGSLVEIVDYGGVFVLVPQHDDPIAAVAGMLAGDTSLIEALLQEHEQARKNE